MHHLHFLNITGVTAEVGFLCIACIKLRLPCAVEEDGIHQIRNSLRIHLADKLRNHAMGLLLAPAIDAVGGFTGCKVKTLDGSLIIVAYLLAECIVHREALVDSDEIGNFHLGLLIKTTCRLKNSLIGFI